MRRWNSGCTVRSKERCGAELGPGAAGMRGGGRAKDKSTKTHKKASLTPFSLLPLHLVMTRSTLRMMRNPRPHSQTMKRSKPS